MTLDQYIIKYARSMTQEMVEDIYDVFKNYIDNQEPHELSYEEQYDEVCFRS